MKKWLLRHKQAYPVLNTFPQSVGPVHVGDPTKLFSGLAGIPKKEIPSVGR